MHVTRNLISEKKKISVTSLTSTFTKAIGLTIAQKNMYELKGGDFIGNRK